MLASTASACTGRKLTSWPRLWSCCCKQSTSQGTQSRRARRDKCRLSLPGAQLASCDPAPCIVQRQRNQTGSVPASWSICWAEPVSCLRLPGLARRETRLLPQPRRDPRAPPCYGKLSIVPAFFCCRTGSSMNSCAFGNWAQENLHLAILHNASIRYSNATKTVWMIIFRDAGGKSFCDLHVSYGLN